MLSNICFVYLFFPRIKTMDKRREKKYLLIVRTKYKIFYKIFVTVSYVTNFLTEVFRYIVTFERNYSPFIIADWI